MHLTRRQFLALVSAQWAAWSWGKGEAAENGEKKVPKLKITGLKVTPVALPDPPLLAAGGCHGPYFLRNVLQLETNAGIIGIGETKGGERLRKELEQAGQLIVGESPFAYRKLGMMLAKLHPATYAGVELACLDACGKALDVRLCELLGGPVREEVEFAAYLFFRYAADHPRVLDDPHLKDGRGRNDMALDTWGEVRTPETMAQLAAGFQKKWGFRIFKLKAGVLQPEVELEALQAIHERVGADCPLRIDPNATWSLATALQIGRQLEDLPLEYYEDPVAGQSAMADVRTQTGLPMSTNMCVTRFSHVEAALRTKPIDVVLGDHHGWGGITAFQTLGRLCETIGWGLSQHSNNHAGISAMIHVGAVVPQLTIASDTHYPWLPDGSDLLAGPNLPIQSGKMSVPSGPGLGVTLDPAKLSHAHSLYLRSGLTERSDSTTMLRFNPQWQRRGSSH